MRSATTVRAGASSSSPAAITPPPMTTISGLKMLTMLVMTTPRRAPISSTASIAASSPSWASSVTSGPTSSRPPATARARPDCRALGGQPRGLPDERRTGGEELRAAPSGAIVLAQRPVELDLHVAQLARAAS